jgi:Fe-S oxidoreductase
MTEQTRPIFWNAPEWFAHHWVNVLDLVYFGVPFLLFGLWAVTIAFGVWRWVRLVRLGQGSVKERLDRIPTRIASVLFDAFGQKIVVREPSGIAHLALYVAFVGLFFGTTIITVEADTKLEFYFGSFYVFYKFMMDVFGLVLVNACAYFLVRRLVDRPRVLENPEPSKMLRTGENLAGYTVPLVLLMAIGLTGFVVEGARINAVPESSAGGAFVGASLAHVFGVFDLGVGFHKWIWWIHLVIVLTFLYTMTLTKLRHVFIAPLNLFFRNLAPRGRLNTITDFENAEKFGVNQVEEYGWKTLLDMAACLECGRCTINCPTVNTGKTLNPKKLVMSQREHLLAKHPAGFAIFGGESATDEAAASREALAQADMIKDVATEEAVWGCTTCGWCEEGCPVGIEHIQRIVDMRRYDVMTEGTFPSEAANALRGMETQSNPWGLASDKRAEWAADLEVPLYADHPTAEVLYWVGCAGSFDMRNQKVSRAFVGILKKAGVDFAILGPEEGCTGDPARRLGNEYLYVTLAQQNVETLNRYNPKKIVTQCPHCFHTIKNEYPDLGGNYEVVHTAEFLAELLDKGKIEPESPCGKRVVYHDPCYMGRHNGEFEGARQVLGAIPGVDLAEVAQSKRRTFCCGAGGGCMWKEEEHGTSRINLERVGQLETVDPETIAVGCPFCMTMLDDAVKSKNLEEQIRVLDLCEMVAQSLEPKPEEASAPAPAASGHGHH